MRAALIAVMFVPGLSVSGGTQESELLYRAAIAAAGASLQLEDSAAAQDWLDQAPKQWRGWEWRYLNRQARMASAFCPPLEGPAAALAVSPDGRLLAAGGARQIVVMETATRRKIWEQQTRGAVQALAFSPDSGRLAAASQEGALRMAHAQSGERIWEAPPGIGEFTAIAWKPDGREIAAVSGAASGRDAAQAAGLLTIVDAATGEARRRIPFLRGKATAVAWSPEGGAIAAANESGALAVWDAAVLEKPPLMATLDPGGGPGRALSSLAFVPGGSSLLAGFADGRVVLWEIKAPLTPRELFHGRRPIHAVAAHPEGLWLAAVSADATVRLFAPDGSIRATLHHARTPGRSAAAAPGGHGLFTGHQDGSVFEWGREVLETARTRWRHGQAVFGFEWSPDGKLAASAARGGTLKLWETDSGRARWEQYAHQFSANALLFSFDQEKLFSVGDDGRVQGMDIQSASLVMTFEHAPDARAVSMALSPDGLHFVTASTRPSAKVFDVVTGATRLTIEGGGGRRTGEVSAADWSLDGALIALGWTGGGAALFEASKGLMKVELDGHPGAVRGIAFAPDGKTAATACDDGLIRIYNTADGALLRTLQGHTEAVLALDFTPDGSRLATASSDLTLRLWDPVSGHSLLRLPLPARANRVRFSPDGARLAAALSDGQILILDAAPR